MTKGNPGSEGKEFAFVERIRFHWGTTLRASNYTVSWDGDPELAQRKVDAINAAHSAAVQEAVRKAKEDVIRDVAEWPCKTIVAVSLIPLLEMLREKHIPMRGRKTT